MTTTRLRSTVLAVMALAAAAGLCVVHAQPPEGRGQGGRGQGRGFGLPPRDAAQPLAVGTAAVSGAVTVAGTGQPARRARVTLNSTEGGGARTATTDDEGRYLFGGLPPGRYNLHATKAGHVGVTYGQAQPGRPGTPIQLADGETFTATLQLPRGSVVTGTVVDEYGDPTPGTQVRVMRYVSQGGRRTLQQSGSGSTDDRGIYRVFGLQPGEYVVSAVPRSIGPAIDIGRLQAGLASVREQFGREGSDGAGRGLAGRAAMLQAQLQQQDEQASGYAPVYYPGTTAASQALPVALGIGEERTAVDFQLQRVPMAQIDGTVVNTTGRPVQNVQLILTDGEPSGPAFGGSSARADAEGRFRLTNVAPGNYRLIARANTLPPGRGGEPMAAGRGGRGVLQPGSERLWGSLEVPVDGRNLTGVIVTLQQGLSVSGRIAFEGTSRQPPADLTRVRVNLAPADPPAPGMLQPAAGSVDAAGKFTIGGVVPGTYRLTASGAGSGWSLESAMVEGYDAADFPFEVRPGGAITGAVVTFTDRTAHLSGVITNQRGQPAPGFTLILYSTDERDWVPQSRRIRATRPATDGQFTFADLRPGEYKLAAVADVEPGAWFDPAFLHEMNAGSLRVTIGDGERKRQDLRVQSLIPNP